MRLLVDLYTVCTGVWVVLWRLLGDRNGWLAMANAWARWLLLLLVPAGVVSAGTRGRGGILLWLAGVGVLLRRRSRAHPLASSPARHPQTERPSTGATLRLLSANLRNKPRSMETAAARLLAQNADVMLFVEAIRTHAEQIDGAFATYPHRCWVPYQPTNMGLAAVSRHPFAVTGFWQKPGLEPYALRLTLALPAGPLDVYCVHVIAPTHQIRRLGPTPLLRTRERQIQTILAEVERRSLPAVLAGDWNQTEAADAYGWITRRLVDGWHEGGRGLGLTWPRVHGEGQGLPLLPLLRLDYHFHTGATRTPRIAVERMERITASIGSDHCPLVSDLSLL